MIYENGVFDAADGIMPFRKDGPGFIQTFGYERYTLLRTDSQGNTGQRMLIIRSDGSICFEHANRPTRWDYL